MVAYYFELRRLYHSNARFLDINLSAVRLKSTVAIHYMTFIGPLSHKAITPGCLRPGLRPGITHNTRLCMAAIQDKSKKPLCEMSHLF